jgi:glyoxylase-like metal-dependent hydrolase (beta-lactamase superfamily II)
MTGAEPIRIWMDPSFRPARLSSNSVVLQGPARFVVMDAGGEPAGLRRHLDRIRAAQSAPPLPVCFVQTHTHIDHIAGLTEFGPLPDAWPYELAVHEEGLRAMRAADRSLSLADLTGRPLSPFRPAGWREWAVSPRTGTGPEPDLSLPLGEGAFLEAFCTPGHSPDSVCWRAGRSLFAGDLLAATAPLVAGIPGWDRDALLASLDRLERILEAHGIEQVHVGHGRPLSRADVAEAIARSRREAVELSLIEPVDVRRVRGTAAYADGLIEEMEELFEEIALRISRLADKLAQIQESRAADEVRGIDRSREVGGLLDAFARFKEEAEARGDGLLGVASKGIQTLRRISDLLAWERFDEVIDGSFLRFARTRVVDFIQRAKGLAPAPEAAATDLGAWVRTYARGLRDPQVGGARLDDVAGGEEEFRRELVRHLSRAPSLGAATLSLSVRPAATPARMDPVRFFDALTRLIECQVAHGAKQVELRTERRGEGAALILRTDGAAWGGDEARATVWEKVFARGGARIDFPSAGSSEAAVFEFDA